MRRWRRRIVVDMSGIGDVDDGHKRGTDWAETKVVKSI